MKFSCVEKHRINSRLQLVKTVRERYTHSNLPIFPSTFQISKTVLLLSTDIVLHYKAILFTGLYEFVICASIINGLPEDIQKGLEKHRHLFILFRDDACTETADLDLENILYYARERHPSASIEILTPENIGDFLRPYPESFDIALMREPLCPSFTVGFSEYFDNLEYRHRTGEIARGTLIISPVDRDIGEVVGLNSRIKIEGEKLNRAMHGDEVYVKDGCVVGISKRKVKTVVGTFCRIEGSYGYIRPVDRRLPEIAVYTFLDESYIDRKVMVYFMEWPTNFPLPRGVIFKVLGPTAKVGTDIEEEVKAIMQHYDIDYAEDNWLTALNERREELGLSKYENTQLMTDSEKTYSHSKEPGSTPESVGLDSKEYSIDIAYEEVKNGKREDLRCLNVYSIDPKGCTDIDDALHAVQCDGYVEVGVHIADVSLFVKPDTPLDLEAKNRSTTVYFPQKRFDMLPSFLSANLCSLVQGADRPAISCIWRFDESYNVIDMRVCRSVICSKGSLSYEEAAEILRSSSSNKASDITAATSSNPFNSIQNVSIDSQVNYNNFLASIKLLGAVASKLRTDRFEKGALELNKQEDHGDSDGEEDDGNIPTYYLVEEFMLLANVYIAKFIYKHNPDYSLLRKHPLPSAIDLEFVDCTSSKTINESLKHIPSENLTIVKRIITRSMQQALYFSSGESSDFYHYGLATEIYTHFTSPIRRYPDILVHRTLGYILDGDEEGIDGLSNYVTTRACSFMNYRNRNAQNASRMVTLLYLYNSMEHEAEPMDATVVSPRDGGYIVFIGKYGIEEYLPAKREFNIFDNVKVSFVWNIKQYCTTWNIPLFIVD